MCAHVACDSALDTDGQRHFQLPAGHVVKLGAVIDELVHCQRDEVDEHDLDDGAQPGERRADGQSHHGAFADRRVDHAALTELFGKPFGHAERAAQGDILAEHVNGRVPPHLFL